MHTSICAEKSGLILICRFDAFLELCNQKVLIRLRVGLYIEKLRVGGGDPINR